MEQQQQKTFRWYDQSPLVSDAFQAWRKMPFRVQQLIAQQICTLVETGTYEKSFIELPENTLRSSFRKLPRFKGYLLKRRWYDKEITLRTAVNLMAFLSMKDQMEIGKAIIALKPVIDDRTRLIGMTPEALKTLIAEAFTAPERIGAYL